MPKLPTKLSEMSYDARQHVERQRLTARIRKLLGIKEAPPQPRRARLLRRAQAPRVREQQAARDRATRQSKRVRASRRKRKNAKRLHAKRRK